MLGSSLQCATLVAGCKWPLGCDTLLEPGVEGLSWGSDTTKLFREIFRRVERDLLSSFTFSNSAAATATRTRWSLAYSIADSRGSVTRRQNDAYHSGNAYE
jgi:hypothetical protein